MQKELITNILKDCFWEYNFNKDLSSRQKIKSR